MCIWSVAAATYPFVHALIHNALKSFWKVRHIIVTGANARFNIWWNCRVIYLKLTKTVLWIQLHFGRWSQTSVQLIYFGDLVPNDAVLSAEHPDDWVKKQGAKYNRQYLFPELDFLEYIKIKLHSSFMC